MKIKSPEVDLFVESVDQVLNSNTAYIQLDILLNFESIEQYVQELFSSGKFYHELARALDWGAWNEEEKIHNIELKLVPLSFIQFKKILIDMLKVSGQYFHDSPYNVKLTDNQIENILDNFIEATINYESSIPYSKNIAKLESNCCFYSMPRDYCNSEKWEIEFLTNHKRRTYRPMSSQNMNNFLSDYFCYLGLDCFLIFHNGRKINFLLTNGGD